MKSGRKREMQAKQAAAAFKPDYPAAAVRPSPNFGARAAGKAISMLILHYTGMKTAAEAEARLTASESQVSAHYLVREDGAVVQMVAESKRAWHAGRACWRGERDVNSCSVGIEIVNAGDLADFPPYPAAQIAAVIALARAIISRCPGIAPRGVLAHSDVAPERKTDPGENFPWDKLAEAGIGHYQPPAPITPGPALRFGDSGAQVAKLQAMLADYGYALADNGVFDPQTESAVTAFQRHFRPEKVDGIADISTIRSLRQLLAALPGQKKRVLRYFQ